MELSTVDEDAMDNVATKLDTCHTLVIALDNSDYSTFSVVMKASGRQFPSTFDKYSALGWKPLSKLNQPQKEELKRLLETETKPIIEEARLDIQKTKTIHGEELPADLSECLSKLDEIKTQKEQKIKELHEEIESVEHARYVLDTMQRSQVQIQNLDMRAKRQKIE